MMTVEGQGFVGQEGIDNNCFREGKESQMSRLWILRK